MADFSQLPIGTPMLVSYGWTGCYVKPLEKILKKHIVCDGKKWQIDGWNSLANAGRWSRSTIRVATPEDIARLEHEQRVHYLKNVKWLEVKQDMVQIIYGMVKESEGK